MVEVGHLEVRAELDGARIRSQLTEQDAQQGGLADAVVADDAEAVAAHDAQREIFQQGPTFEAVRDIARLDDLATREVRRLVEQNTCGARPFDSFRADLTQLLERAHASFVACPARFDTLADPGFLFCKFLVE